MPKGKMFVLSNPTTPAQEAEYNNWYNNIHAGEVCALPGVTGMKRFRAVAGQLAPGEPKYRYMAVYDLDDADRALAGLKSANFNMSDAIDTNDVLAYIYEETFTYKK